MSVLSRVRATGAYSRHESTVRGNRDAQAPSDVSGGDDCARNGRTGANQQCFRDRQSHALRQGDVIDPRFVFFALVGSIGLMVHLAALKAGLAVLPLNFRDAQIGATLVAMTCNFLLNNELTYRDRRLKGIAMLRGFLLFCLFASVGAFVNVDLAQWLYSGRSVWWVAGAAGAVMSALWNYAMSTLFVWRAR